MGAPIQNYATDNIQNVTELNDALLSANNGDELTSSANFDTSNFNITMPTVDVTINGNNVTSIKDKLTISGDGSGKLTIKNLTFDGTLFPRNLVTISNTKGPIIFDNVVLKNGKDGVMDISAQDTSQIVINNSLFDHNSSSNSGSAITLRTGNLTINNTTISNNIGTSVGYECGAIATKSYKGTLTINNSLFENNVNQCYNSGVVGGGGGALSMHYLEGNVSVNQSIFRGNRTNGGESGGNRSGGAIQSFKNGGLTSFNNNITGSTFYNNSAGGPKTDVEQRGGTVVLGGTSAFAMASASTSGNSLKITRSGYTFKGDLLRKGYTFKGWSLVKNDNNNILTEGSFYIMEADTKVYAVWEKYIDPIVEFKLTYDGNGNTSGTAPVDKNLYQAGQKATLLGKNDLYRKGYTFKGWSLVKDDDSNILTEGTLYTITENTTLYAVWKKDKDSVIPPTGVAHSNNGLFMVGIGAVALTLSLIVKRKRNK